jgi:hypothetical protein
MLLASAVPSLSSRDSLQVTRFLVGVSSSSPSTIAQKLNTVHVLLLLTLQSSHEIQGTLYLLFTKHTNLQITRDGPSAPPHLAQARELKGEFIFSTSPGTLALIKGTVCLPLSPSTSTQRLKEHSKSFLAPSTLALRIKKAVYLLLLN